MESVHHTRVARRAFARIKALGDPRRDWETFQSNVTRVTIALLEAREPLLSRSFS